MSLKNNDKVILVDSDGNQVGEMDKYEAHEHPAKLHRASSVWLFNSRGQVLLQKRSANKIVGAGWWGNTICGNVKPGESYEDCAKRRLREEIGIESMAGVKAIYPNLKKIFKFTYKAYCNEKYGEHEVDQVFVGQYDGEVILNKNEVSEVAWVDFDDLVAQLDKVIVAESNKNSRNLPPSTEETLKMDFEQLKEKTTPFRIKINREDQLLAPWTWMMLRDARFIYN